jgi:predicted nucleic acid-binding protein
MVLVDTSVWIDYFRGTDSRQTDALDRLFDEDSIIIGDLILVELLQGFRTKKELAAADEIVSRLEYRDMAGREVALKAAENYRMLRTKGLTVRKTIDMLIGTFCLVNGIRLLHNDRDFDPMEKHLGLRVVR